MLQAFDKGGAPRRESDIDIKERRGVRSGHGDIRCPRCGFRPGRDDTWMCSCEHFWNTFDTGGVCPACRRQWLDTQCPRCGEWSPHRDWYADPPDPGPSAS